MLLKTSGAKAWFRVGVLGLASVAAVLAISTDPADARRRKSKKAARHHVASTYNPPSASLVVDANSGRVLHSENPDALRHPASLTKIMTLYMLFERLEAGTISLNTEMDVTAHASVQAPTKLGLKPGQTLKVEDAIKALVTKSANDAAVVIAEHIGGSEERFAEMMTRKARALGMSRTTYRNASGLPNDEQNTTARDQVLLGRAIQDRFPKYYRFFATASFNYHGREMRNHNRLLGRVDGIDGIKTGYTRASGFNLVSSIRRDGRHLVAAVLGGRSGGSRDAKMRSLLAEYIDEGATRRTVAKIEENTRIAAIADRAPLPPIKPASTKLASAPAVDEDVAEDMAEGDAETGAEAAARPTAPVNAAPQALAAAAAGSADRAPPASGVIKSESIAALIGSTDPIKPVKVTTVTVRTKPQRVAGTQLTASDDRAATASIPVVAASPEPGEKPQKTDKPARFAALDVSQGTKIESAKTETKSAEPAKAKPGESKAAEPKQAAVVRSGWIIQVGAFESEGEARERIEKAKAQAKGSLAKADSFTERAAKGDKTFYRARFAGLKESEAESVCRLLKRNDIACITIRN